MKKNLRFYALIAVLALAAFLYLGGNIGGGEKLQDAAEITDIAAEPAGGNEAAPAEPSGESAPQGVEEDGRYYSKDEVALYIHTYGRLPDNYISKKDAEKAGWEGGSVEKFFPGMAIGGSRFGNYEGLLPDAPGRTWTECDINTEGKSSRGPERIVFSNDGLIYYTADHYESFELLYGEE